MKLIDPRNRRPVAQAGRRFASRTVCGGSLRSFVYDVRVRRRPRLGPECQGIRVLLRRVLLERSTPHLQEEKP